MFRVGSQVFYRGLLYTRAQGNVIKIFGDKRQQDDKVDNCYSFGGTHCEIGRDAPLVVRTPACFMGSES